MTMKASERWHCTNPGCGCEVLVESGGSGAIAGESGGARAAGSAVARAGAPNPTCACGGVMKKKYVAPRITYLEFLRVEDACAAPSRSRQE